MKETNQRKAQALQTRQQLIEAAYRLIGTSGYEALTSSALLAEAGLSKGALYHHFESMEDLAYAALESAMMQSFAGIDPAQYASLSVYLDAFENAFFGKTLRDAHATKALFSFVRVGMFNARYKALLRKMLEHGFTKFAADLDYYLKGQLTKKRLATVVRLIDAVVGGLGVHWYTLAQRDRTLADWRCFREMLTVYIEQNAKQK